MAALINLFGSFAFLVAATTLIFPQVSPAIEIQTLKGTSPLRLSLDRSVGQTFAVAAPEGIGTILFDTGPFLRGNLSKSLMPPSLIWEPYRAHSGRMGFESALRRREWQVFGLERFLRQKKTQNLTTPSGSSPGSTPFYLDLT
jgi:hypothetical protein